MAGREGLWLGLVVSVTAGYGVVGGDYGIEGGDGSRGGFSCPLNESNRNSILLDAYKSVHHFSLKSFSMLSNNET